MFVVDKTLQMKNSIAPEIFTSYYNIILIGIVLNSNLSAVGEKHPTAAC